MLKKWLENIPNYYNINIHAASCYDSGQMGMTLHIHAGDLAVDDEDETITIY
jgi:hypothetical protein